MIHVHENGQFFLVHLPTTLYIPSINSCEHAYNPQVSILKNPQIHLRMISTTYEKTICMIRPNVDPSFSK